MTKNPLAGLAALGLGGLAPANTGGLNPAGKVIEIIYFVSVKYNYLLTLQVFNNIFTVFRYFVVPRLFLHEIRITKTIRKSVCKQNH